MQADSMHSEPQGLPLTLQLGIKSVPPTLDSKVLTTGLPGKSLSSVYVTILCQHIKLDLIYILPIALVNKIQTL